MLTLYIEYTYDSQLGTGNLSSSQIIFVTGFLQHTPLVESDPEMVDENILVLALWFFTQNDVTEADEFAALEWFG